MFSIPKKNLELLKDPNSWKFSYISHYNPNQIAYKPHEYITKDEKALSLCIASVETSARFMYTWGNGDCQPAVAAHFNNTTPQIERGNYAKDMVIEFFYIFFSIQKHQSGRKSTCCFFFFFLKNKFKKCWIFNFFFNIL